MYQLQTTNSHNPFAKFAHNDFHGAPSRDQSTLMALVTEALQNGLFYTTDMFAFVTESMKELLPADNFIDKEYLKKSMRTEHGPLGMDIYHCRKAVEKIIKDTNNRTALNALLRDGKVTIDKAIRGKISVGGKNFSSVTPVTILKSDGSIIFRATGRGHKREYEFTMGANDTRLLQMLTPRVKDKTVTTAEGDSEGSNGVFLSLIHI